MKYFVHNNAIVETRSIGENTKIWAFSHIQGNVKIGENVNIGEQCYIENGVNIGNNVTVKNGVTLWDGIEIEDNVFIGPYAVFTNDMFPRSKNKKFNKLLTILKKGCTIGANATILPGLTIREYAMVGAGSVVTSSVDKFTIVCGNPAKVCGFICICGNKLNFKKNRVKCSCKREYLKKGKEISIVS